MKDILAEEVEKYQEQHGHDGMTREDVIMLKILEAKLEYESLIRERITNLEGMLERGGSWETIEALTGIDEAGLHKLREELNSLRGNYDNGVD